MYDKNFTFSSTAVDPMASMIASIRTGNIALKKVKAETKVSPCPINPVFISPSLMSLLSLTQRLKIT